MFAKLITGLALAFVVVSCTDGDDRIDQPEQHEEYSGGLDFTVFDFSENAFGHEGSGIAGTQFTSFVVGNSLFRTNWVTAPSSAKTFDGLGPMMNAISCGSCHFKDGRGQPALSGNQNGLLIRMSVPGTGPHGEPLDDSNYGGQFQDRGILGVTPEGKVSITYTAVNGQYADGTTFTLRKPAYQLTYNYGAPDAGVMFSPRIAQQVPGLGLLENVPQQTILAFADEDDANGDGISGRPNWVWSERDQREMVGRFGWKANQPSIVQQCAAAFNHDIGITSTVFPQHSLTPYQQTEYQDIPHGGEPELADERLDEIVLYIQSLAVPGRRNYNDQEVLQGKKIFSQLNCHACHIPVMQTGSGHAIQSLNGQTIRPYTDLLLHDMGEGLADHRPDFKATGTEWRTPPLWGIGLINTVNRHTTLLHDGRARNIEEAILWHDGEAKQSKENFMQLSATERKTLIKFLESL